MCLLKFNFLAIVVAVVALNGSCWAHQVPKETVMVFDAGFMVSIPAEPGITLFAFHGKLNEPMNGLESGTWSQDVIKIKQGRFFYWNRNDILRPGDVLHYWLYIIKDGLGYQRENGRFVVQ